MAERLTQITGTHFTGNRISNWEMLDCKALPSLALFPAICKALYCLPAELFGMVEPQVTREELMLVRHWRKLDDAGKHTVEAVMDSQLLRLSSMGKE